MGGPHSAQVPGPPTPPLQLPLCGLIPWVSGLRALSAGAQSRAGSGVTGVSEPGRVWGPQACPSLAGSRDLGTSWVLSGVSHAVLSSALSYLEAREVESEAVASSCLCCSPFAHK